MKKTTFEAQNGRKEMVLYYKDLRAINWFLTVPLEADDDSTDWSRLTKTIQVAFFTANGGEESLRVFASGGFFSLCCDMS